MHLEQIYLIACLQGYAGDGRIETVAGHNGGADRHTNNRCVRHSGVLSAAERLAAEDEPGEWSADRLEGWQFVSFLRVFNIEI